ncbi:MAG: serine hydrolase domain-containing protein [Pseudohongiella sp.]|nr:serine hydrolase domain-containing protein [Pseudohongiella sp.]
MTTNIPRRWLVTGLLIPAIAVAAFKLFEPVVVYNAGWRDLPDAQYLVDSRHLTEWEDAAGKADAWLLESREKLGTPALSAAISIDGELVWAGAVGYSDLDAASTASPDTTFRIGSSSKAVTSVAMGVLIESGAIDLDAPISDYISDLSGPLSSVTTRQAMNHTAGVRDYGICLCFPIWEYYNRSYYETQRETLGIVEGSDLLFVPGERFFYTSYGYNVTGAVIESVTGKGFNDYLKDSVFVPLGLDGIRVDSGTPRATDAVFYELANGRFKPVFQVDNSNKLPSGGILATPSDLVQLGQQMIAPTLFSSDTRDQLVRRQFLADGEPNPQGYALGWRTGETQLLRGTITTPVYHHHGVAYGAVSHFSVYPQIGMVVSVMMNKNQGDFDGVPAQLVDLFVTGLQWD